MNDDKYHAEDLAQDEEQAEREMLEGEMLVEARDIVIDAQPIELYKVLKLADVVNSGGQAKLLIADGYVAVNGELEYQKRKKIYAEDVIEFDGEFFYIVCDKAPALPKQSAFPKSSSGSQFKSEQKQKTEALQQSHGQKAMPKNVKGRGSIKF